MRSTVVAWVLALAILVLSRVPASEAAASQAEGRVALLTGVASLWVVPAESVVVEGDEILVEIRVDAAVPFYGAQVQLNYDPALLSLVSGSPEPGGVFTDVDPNYYWPQPLFDPVAGSVWLFPTRRHPAGEFIGTGTLACLRLRALAPGDATLTLSNVLLSNLEGEALVPTPLTGGLLHILEAVTVTGQVELQGRPGHWQGAAVRLERSELPQYVYTTTVTDSTGTWSIAVVAVGTYTVTVKMPRYLDAERLGVTVSADPTVLPKVRLLGGDVNDDDTIDIVDVAAIGGQFGLSVPPAHPNRDINADGQIDIIDLVLAAGNYMLASPVPWP